MGFDDLARHMASRDGKKKLAEQAGDADQIVEEAARVDRRMSRRRDLILGPLLLVGGIVVLLFNYLVFVDAADPTPNPHRPTSEGAYPIYFTVAAASAVITGLRWTIRGATSTVKEAFEPEVTLRERRWRFFVWGIVLAAVAATVLAIVLWPRGGAPGGKLRNHRGELVDLSTRWGDRRVVVMFYAGFDRSSDQLRELNARLPEFDATVIAISSGSSSRAAQLHEQLELRFDLYSDSTLTVIPTWGVPFVIAYVTSDAVFIVEPGGKISYKHIGEHPALDMLAARTRH